MRRSELDPRVFELAQRQLGACGAALILGATAIRFEGSSVSLLDSPDALSRAPASTRRHDGALWLVDGQVVPGVSAICRVLVPGAPLMLVCAMKSVLRDALRSLLGGKRPTELTLVDLCDALLLSGLCDPRAHTEVPGWLVASARVPANYDALDEVFRQLPTPASR